MAKAIEQLFVAGAGAMGHGIAQVAAMTPASQGSIRVALYDVADAPLAAARDKIAWSLGKLAEKGKLTEPVDAVMARLTTTTDLAGGASADLVLEAIPERENLKRDLFTKLHTICPASVVFASNTSAIPITALASASGRPDRFCGIHFFHPVPLMPPVEVIRGERTSDATAELAVAFVKQLGKEPIALNRDVPGFAVNRVLIAALHEAIRLVETGVISAADMDKAMRLACGWKMGPLETADFSGLDVFLHAADAIVTHGGDAQFQPPAMLKRLVSEGKLGRKSGSGFYEHG